MKLSTQKIKGLINQISEKIPIIETKIKQGQINTDFSHQETSLEEALEHLSKDLDVLKQNINRIDTIPYIQRDNISKTLSNIWSNVSNNTINNQTAFIQQVNSLDNIVYVNFLRELPPEYPDFNKKISQLNELISKEKELIKLFEEYQEKFENFDKKYSKAIDHIKEIENSSQRIVNLLEQARTNLNEINTNKANIDNIFNEIRGIKTTSQKYLDEIESKRNKILEFEKEVDNYIEKMQSSKESFEKEIEAFKNEIKNFKQNTEEIINKNQEYQKEIENILTSAVGTNLFKSFEKRKEELEKGLNWWLAGIIASTVILIGLGFWIYLDIKSEHIEWTRTFLKIAVSFPMLYLLVFFTNRYSKDKQLLEEYAFKSSLSLALKPYAELVDEVEKNKADSKYRDFLIASIMQIFSSPTDKLYKHYKPEGLDVKEIIKSLNIFKKSGED